MKSEQEKCINKKIGAHLMDYVNGRLPMDAIDDFRKHLFECDACFQRYLWELESKKVLKDIVIKHGHAF